MTRAVSPDRYVRMTEDDFEELLARAAQKGARCAHADVGLDGKEAALDIHDLRSLIECVRFARLSGPVGPVGGVPYRRKPGGGWNQLTTCSINCQIVNADQSSHANCSETENTGGVWRRCGDGSLFSVGVRRDLRRKARS